MAVEKNEKTMEKLKKNGFFFQAFKTLVVGNYYVALGLFFIFHF